MNNDNKKLSTFTVVITLVIGAALVALILYAAVNMVVT